MTRELRILHLALLPFWSAIAWHTVTLAKALRQRGHICWVAGRTGTPILAAAMREGIPVAEDLVLPDLRPWNWFQAVSALRRFLMHHRIDVAFVHTGQGHLETHLARRALSTAIIRVRADARVPRPGRGHRWLYRSGTDRIAVTGAYMLEHHLDPMRIERDQIFVLPPGIDLAQVAREPAADRARSRDEIRRRYEIPAGVPLMGVVGRLSPVKGHRVLLEAAGLVAKQGRNFRLLIVGEEKEVSPAELRELARSFEIEDRLIITGRVEDPLLHAAALDIGVIPSLGSEAVSRSALEFMSVGVPVVASLVGVLPEVIDEDELLVPPGRPQALATVLGKLLDDPTWAGRLGERLYERVNEEYSLDVLGRRAEEAIREALDARGRICPGERQGHGKSASTVGDHHHAQ
jgi:glycosyltransferase involved in cell wall biosynthesis